MPLIDVIIPVYNGKAYIAPLLETFRRQGHFSDFRLLFVNDGSADGTEDEIARLSKDCPFEVLLLSQANAGVSAARNLGLQNAVAPYVAFLDADDRVTPDYIETLLPAARAGKTDVLLFGQQRTDGKTPLAPANAAPPAPEPKGTTLERFLTEPTRFGAVNLLLRRDFLNAHALRFAEGYAYYEDYHFLISALLAAEAVSHTPAPLYDYVRRAGSAMGTFTAARLTCLSLLRDLSPAVAACSPTLGTLYETAFLPRVYWSVLWQAALAAPGARAFLRFAKITGAKTYLTKLLAHPDQTTARSSRLFLISPAAFYAAAATFGKTRSAVTKSTPAAWERLLRSLPARPGKILVYGMSHVAGGIESYLKTLVGSQAPGTFDFLCDFPDAAYKDALQRKNCEIHFIPSKSADLSGHLAGTLRVLRAHPEYGTVYFNILDAGAAVTALAPFVLGRKIVVHSHNGDTDKPLLHRLCKPLLALELSGAAACSKTAAAHMFYKRRAKTALLVPNAIPVERFRFDPDRREETRGTLGVLPETTVLLQVGRLTRQKNPLLAASLAAALKKRDGDYRIFLAGEGEERAAIEAAARDLNVPDMLTLLGSRSDIPALLSAADVFLLPSFYEGFPIVGVEAQAAGLSCLFSDRITPEIKLTDGVTFLPPDADPERWADAVEQHKNDRRRDTADALKRAGYDSESKEAFADLMRLLRG